MGPAAFDAFSRVRLFAGIGSPIVDVVFSVPGTPAAAATVRGCGVVVSDVDCTGSSPMEFFDPSGASLGLFSVVGVSPAPGTANSQGSFSFLGVSSSAGERIARVRITSGSKGIDGNFVGLDDAVVMDDFIVAELQAVPEPARWAPLLAGLVAGGRRRHAGRACRQLDVIIATISSTTVTARRSTRRNLHLLLPWWPASVWVAIDVMPYDVEKVVAARASAIRMVSALTGRPSALRASG